MMKKKFWIGLIFIFAAAIFLLAGCDAQKELTVDKIAIKEGTVFSTSIGKFDCSDYTLILTKDGAETEAPLTLDMISAADAMNFYKAGSYTITVNAYGQTCEFRLDVAENEFSGYSFEDMCVEYTGETFFAEVKGDLPQGTVVLYPDGNSFSEVGKNRISAILTCNNYKTEVLYANVEITPARHDVSGIRFEDATFVYDGTPKSISVTGDLPAGVTVAYRIGSQYTNSRTNANESGYEVTASFISANVNYEAIPDMKARLIIKKADYTMPEIEAENLTFEYSGETHRVVFNHEDKLPKGVSFKDVSATYVDADGETQTVFSENVLIGSAVRKAVLLRDAHDYTLTYSFSVTDAANYNVPASVEDRLTITKVAYELSGIDFSDEAFIYDGEPKSLAISGTISDDLRVEYVGNGQTEAGEYEVIANFIVIDSVNYTAPAAMRAKLYILKSDYSIDANAFDYYADIPYTGNAILPDLSIKLPEGLVFETTVYKTESGAIDENMEEIVAAVELGSYVLKLHVSGEKIGNYYAIGDVYLPFRIVRCSFDTTALEFVSEFDYDGKPHYPEVKNLPEGLTVGYDHFAIDVADGRVEVLATFLPENDFYGDYYIIPTPVRTYVQINPTEYAKSYQFTMADKTVVYNGSQHSVEGQMEGEYMPDVPLRDVITVTYTMRRIGLNVVFDGNSATEVGEYVITAAVKITDDDNYYFPEFSAKLTVTRGAVRASDIESAISVKSIPNGKTVVLDESLLGDNYFVLADFLGYYEKDSDGNEGILYTEPIELNFCDHNVYLKFRSSALYNFVDDGGVVIPDYAPSVLVELDDEYHFDSEYDAEITQTDISIIKARKGGVRFATLETLKPSAEMMATVTGYKLVHKTETGVEYDVETVTEGGITYFLMPAVELVGDYELKIEVEFVNVRYRNVVTVSYGGDLTVRVVGADETESYNVVSGALRSQPIFRIHDGTASQSYYWGELDVELVIAEGDRITLSIDDDKFGSAALPYPSAETDGVYFGFSKIIYRCRATENGAWTTEETTANGLELSEEGYYTVYFVPRVYDNLTGTDAIFSGYGTDASRLPRVEFFLRYTSHSVSDAEIGEYVVFQTGGNWKGPAKFGELINEDYVYEHYVIGTDAYSLVVSDIVDDSGLPYYVTLTVSEAEITPPDFEYMDAYLMFLLTVNVDGEPRDTKIIFVRLETDGVWP